MRDDFSAATKELLARRVGFKCSNPGCRQPTSDALLYDLEEDEEGQDDEME